MLFRIAVSAIVVATLGCTEATPTAPAAPQAPPVAESAKPTTSAATVQTATTDIEIDDPTLQKFVFAFVRLNTIETQAQETIDELAENNDLDGADQIRKDADFLAKTILADLELERDLYLEIRQRLNTDPELNQRAKKFLDAASKNVDPELGPIQAE